MSTKMSTTEALLAARFHMTGQGRFCTRDEALALLDAALAQQAAQATDEVVERLMGLAEDYAQSMAADGGCGLSPTERDNETDASKAALRTALSQAVPQAGGLSDAEFLDIATKEFPFWREDIQAAFVIQLGHAIARAILARAGAVAQDAARWRWWRQRWAALCRMEVAASVGLDLSRIHVTNANDMDAVTDAARAGAVEGGR